MAMAIALAIGCNPSTARPPFPPFRTSVVDTIGTDPEEVIAVVRARFAEDSLGINVFHERDGFVETVALDYPAATGRQQRVVIRVWADPLVGNRTILTGEIAYEWTADPSRIPRDRERAVGADHPARTYLRDAFRTIRNLFVQ